MIGAASSVEDVGEVVVVQELNVLLTGSAQAVEQIVGVGARELSRVLEAGAEVSDIVVVLNGLDNVALALELKHLLGDHDVGVVHVEQEGTEVALVLLQTRRVAERTLVVRDGPLRGAHHTQVVVPVRVVGADKRVLREGSSLDCACTDGLVSRSGRKDCLTYLGRRVSCSGS